jgi:squalene synthase HpnC
MTEEQAYTYCVVLARRHYENFPVASVLVPRGLRRHVAAIYAFAREADDIADEGDLTGEERLSRLAEWEAHLARAAAGEAELPVFIALRATIRDTGIDTALLSALCAAFRQDITVTRYRTYDDLLGYCRNSANPVGRLVLHLFDVRSPEAGTCSDAVCTGLQCANFWQDVAVDLGKGRIYLPLEDCARFGYTEGELRAGIADDRFRALLRFQVERTRRLFAEGEAIIGMTRGRLRFELAATLRGGRAICDAIERLGYDTLHHRPVLSTFDRLALLWHGVKESAS